MQATVVGGEEGGAAAVGAPLCAHLCGQKPQSLMEAQVPGLEAGVLSRCSGCCGSCARRLGSRCAVAGRAAALCQEPRPPWQSQALSSLGSPNSHSRGSRPQSPPLTCHTRNELLVCQSDVPWGSSELKATATLPRAPGGAGRRLFSRSGFCILSVGTDGPRSPDPVAVLKTASVSQES